MQEKSPSKRKVQWENQLERKKPRLSTTATIVKQDLPSYYMDTPANILENEFLWEHQKTAYKKVHEQLCASSDSATLLVVLPTGTGKSGLAHILPFGIRGRILMITYNIDGVTQMSSSVKFLQQQKVIPKTSCLPRIYQVQSKEDLVNLGHNDNYDSDLYITNIHKFDLEEHEKVSLRNVFSLIIIDEGHHAATQTYHSVLSNAKERNIPTILLTATPRRSDQIPLNATIVYSLSLEEAIGKNLIKHPCLIKYGDKSLKKKDCILRYGDKVNMLHMMVRLLEQKRNASGIFHQGIVVCASKRDVDETQKILSSMALQINGVPLRCAVYHSGMHLYEREANKQKIVKKELDIVVHCGLLTEGHDYPEVSVTALLCNVNWIGKFSQIVGRCIRYLHKSSNVLDNTAHILLHAKRGESLWAKYYNELHTEIDPTESKILSLKALKPDAIHQEEQRDLFDNLQYTDSTLMVRDSNLKARSQREQAAAPPYENQWEVDVFPLKDCDTVNRVFEISNGIIINIRSHLPINQYSSTFCKPSSVSDYHLMEVFEDEDLRRTKAEVSKLFCYFTEPSK